MVHEALSRLLTIVCWVLTAHLRHLPPMCRRGVEMSCVAGAVGMSTLLAQLIVDDSRAASKGC